MFLGGVKRFCCNLIKGMYCVATNCYGVLILCCCYFMAVMYTVSRVCFNLEEKMFRESRNSSFVQLVLTIHFSFRITYFWIFFMIIIWRKNNISSWSNPRSINRIYIKYMCCTRTEQGWLILRFSYASHMFSLSWKTFN